MIAATGPEKIWQKAAQLHRIHRRASISPLPKGADTNLQLLFEFVVDAGKIIDIADVSGKVEASGFNS